MLGEYVTSSHAKKGGDCPECGIAIGMFNRIHKYTVVGASSGTTPEGNGPGVWVCSWCHARQQKHPVASGPREIDPFLCAACLSPSNPVVEWSGKHYCHLCYARICTEQGKLL